MNKHICLLSMLENINSEIYSYSIRYVNMLYQVKSNAGHLACSSPGSSSMPALSSLDTIADVHTLFWSGLYAFHFNIHIGTTAKFTELIL